MIEINKKEKELVVGRFQNLCVVRTVPRKTKRHHYYMEERPDAMAFIRRLRGEPSNHNRRNSKNKNYQRRDYVERGRE